MITFKDWIKRKAIGSIFNSVHTFPYMESFGNRVVLFNTFWGFDHPIMIPPNFIVTGPLFK